MAESEYHRHRTEVDTSKGGTPILFSLFISIVQQERRESTVFGRFFFSFYLRPHSKSDRALNQVPAALQMDHPLDPTNSGCRAGFSPGWVDRQQNPMVLGFEQPTIGLSRSKRKKE